MAVLKKMIAIAQVTSRIGPGYGSAAVVPTSGFEHANPGG
jgi:hypothetical protein